MNFSFRISSVLLIVASCTMLLLTVLMHFKYHMTRSNLVIDRLNVAAAGIGQPIDNAIKLGIEMDDIKNINESINNTKRFDSTIKNIIVFKTTNDKIYPIASVENQVFSEEQNEQIRKKIRASKKGYWSGELNENIGFSGLTIKNVAEQEKGGVLICYDLHKIHMKEIAEIKNLYQRLLFALAVVIIINFIVAFKNTSNLNKMIEMTEVSILYILKNIGKKIDLGKIDEPVIKSQMRAMASKVTLVGQYINKLDQFLIQAKSNALEKEDSE